MENILRDCAEKLVSAANSIVPVPAGQTQLLTPVNEGVNNVNIYPFFQHYNLWLLVQLASQQLLRYPFPQFQLFIHQRHLWVYKSTDVYLVIALLQLLNLADNRMLHVPVVQVLEARSHHIQRKLIKRILSPKHLFA